VKTSTKRCYRSIPVNSVRLAAVLEAAQGEKIVVAIDVAKEGTGTIGSGPKKKGGDGGRSRPPIRRAWVGRMP
jgi:hypothetical protein